MDEKAVFEILKEALPYIDTMRLLEVAYSINRAYIKEENSCGFCYGEGILYDDVVCNLCNGTGARL